MAIQMHEHDDGSVLHVILSGKLTHQDYQQWLPDFEQHVKEHGKVYILLEMRDFHGYELGAVWDDIKFDARHFSDIERIAMVGDKNWEKFASMLCKPFTTAKIRYFDAANLGAAKEWLTETAVRPVST